MGDQKALVRAKRVWRLSLAVEWKELVRWEVTIVCLVEERREGAPQMVVGCLWWRIFLAMVCLKVECEVVKLGRVKEDWGM